MKIGNLETVFSSAPVEYNNLTFEILLNGEPIVRVDREEGLDQLKAELFGTDSKLQVRVSLDDLMDALNHAKTGLLSRG